jgi:hypothetical protein
MVALRSKGRPVRRQRSPADLEPKSNSNVLASRSVWPAGQDEGEKRNLSVVRVAR